MRDADVVDPFLLPEEGDVGVWIIPDEARGESRLERDGVVLDELQERLRTEVVLLREEVINGWAFSDSARRSGVGEDDQGNFLVPRGELIADAPPELVRPLLSVATVRAMRDQHVEDQVA